MADKALWDHPHADCPQRVKEIWLGDLLDVQVRVGGVEVRAAALKGQAKKSTKPQIPPIEQLVGDWRNWVNSPPPED